MILDLSWLSAWKLFLNGLFFGMGFVIAGNVVALIGSLIQRALS